MAITTIQQYKAAADAIARYEEIVAAKGVLDSLLATDPTMVLPVSIGTGTAVVSIEARLAEFVPLLAASVVARKAEVEALGLEVD